MSMALEFGIEVDGDFAALAKGTEVINQTHRAQVQHNAAVAATAGHQRTLVSLQQQHNNLLASAHNLTRAGNSIGAAQATAAAAQLATQIQITQQMQKQAAVAQQGGGAGGGMGGALLAQLRGAGGALLAPLAAFAGGAAIVGTLRGFLGGIGQYAGDVKDLAEQLQLTTNEVQGLDQAASDTGLRVNNFFVALSQLGAARRAAAEGDDKLIQKFERFGISMRMLQDPTLRSIDLLKALGKVSGDLNASDRTALRDLLGRGGERIAKATSDFSASNASGAEKQNIEAIDKFEKGYTRAFKNLKVLGAEVFGSLLRDDFGGAADAIVRRAVSAWTALGTLIGNAISPPSANPEADARTAYNRAMVLARTEHQRVNGADAPFTAEQQATATAGFTGPAAQYAAFLKFQEDAKRRLNLGQVDQTGGTENERVANDRWEQLLAENAKLEAKFLRAGLTPAEEQRWTQVKHEQAAAESEAGRAGFQRERGRTDEAQARRDLGMTFAQATALAAQGQGPLFSVAKSEAQLANEKKIEALQMSLLTTEQKRQALLEKRAKLLADIANTPEGESKQRRIGEVLGVNEQLAGLQNQSTAFSTAADDQQKRGLFTGTVSGDPIRSGINDLVQQNRQLLAAFAQAGIDVKDIRGAVNHFTGR